MKARPMKWILKMSKSQKHKMFWLILANAFFSALSVVFAFAIKEIIDGAVRGDKQRLILWSVIILLIVVMQFIFRVITNGLLEHIKGKLEMSYKSHVFSQIIIKKYDKINGYHSGELMNRLTQDVSIVADGASTILPTVVSAFTRLICAVVALVILDWHFAIAFTVAGMMVFAVISLLRGKLKSLHKKVQETDGKSRSFMQECIENLLAVKAFSVNEKICNQADELQEENFKVKMKRRNYSVIGHAAYNFIFSAGYLFALIYGAVKILGGALSYGSLSAILQLVNNVQVPFASLSNILPKYYAMLASAERLIEIDLIDNEEISGLVDKDSVYSKMDGIEIENLTFSYDRDVVLKNTSTRIDKGDFVIISGTSGGGKSTLMKLMLGVYPPNEGEILISLKNKKMPIGANTRPLFSYVPQGNMLFSGTIRDNVTFVNNDATEQQIEKALKVSEAYSFVNELPDGLSTVVGENGLGLSEGQIQRIAIARAVLSNSPILLLDEATSALDENTELKVLNNLKALKGLTVVLITHRKAALSVCDKKIELKGKKFLS